MNQQKIVRIINEIYHDWEAKSYFKRHPEIFEREKEHLQKFVGKFFVEPVKKRVLDIGCGTGFVAQALGHYLAEGDEFVCSDISTDMLNLAEQNLKKCNFLNKFEFVKGSLEELNFAPNSFDIIVMNSVLHHLPNVEDFFQEVNKILKPSGKFIIFHEPNALFFRNWFLKNNFLLFQNIRNIIFKIRYKFKKTRKNIIDTTRDSLFASINDKLEKEELIDHRLTPSEIKQFVDYGSPTASDKIDKNRGFDIYKIQPQSLPNFEILGYTTTNYLCKINHQSNFLLNFYNFLLNKLWPRSGSVWGVVLQKNDTTS